MGRRHFVFLDGMRGLAALMVAVYHFGTGYGALLKPEHAYLAVDFFFCLSGFVIASAYDDQLEREPDLWAFLKRRWIRLYPMLALSVVLASAVLGGEWLLGHKGDLLTWTGLTAGSLLLLPAGFLFGMQGYPINSPIWSLAFEFVANLLYGLKVGARLRGVAAVVAIVVLAAILAIPILRAGTLRTLGFYSPQTFGVGLVRVLFPFFTGATIFRSGLYKRIPALPEIVPAVVLIVMLGMPFFQMSPSYELLSALVLVPLLVLFGAAAKTGDGMRPVWSEFGRLSYPLYLIHMPISILLWDLCTFHSHRQISPYLLMAAALVVSIAASWLALAVYDQPVRAWLARRTQASSAKSKTVAEA